MESMAKERNDKFRWKGDEVIVIKAGDHAKLEELGIKPIDVAPSALPSTKPKP
jgi:hypothetical protein